MIAVSIYYYLIKYQAKNLLPFYNTNNKLNKFCIDSINWMSNKVRDINIKNHTHYFFDDIINIKDFDPNNIKIDEK